jgi:transcriptional regulator of acetoin/glycerol metabolism
MCSRSACPASRNAARILDRQINQTGRVRSLSPDAIAHLKARPWPGGLFELQAVLAQALLLSQGALIEAAQLAGEQAEGQQTALVPAQARTRSIRASEEALIRRVLVEEEGNRSSTARALGINRTTLYNKLRQYDIS